MSARSACSPPTCSELSSLRSASLPPLERAQEKESRQRFLGAQGSPSEEKTREPLSCPSGHVQTPTQSVPPRSWSRAGGGEADWLEAWAQARGALGLLPLLSLTSDVLPPKRAPETQVRVSERRLPSLSACTLLPADNPTVPSWRRVQKSWNCLRSPRARQHRPAGLGTFWNRGLPGSPQERLWTTGSRPGDPAALGLRLTARTAGGQEEVAQRTPVVTWGLDTRAAGRLSPGSRPTPAQSLQERTRPPRRRVLPWAGSRAVSCTRQPCVWSNPK